jgi:hypothetical protein
VYQAIDRSLGRIVDALGEDAFLLVLATHGMGPRYDASAALDSVLRRLDGMDVSTTFKPMETMRKMWMQLPGVIRRPFRRVADVIYDAPRQQERAKRRFYTIPTTDNCGGIRVNLRGREPRALPPAMRLARGGTALARERSDWRASCETRSAWRCAFRRTVSERIS